MNPWPALLLVVALAAGFMPCRWWGALAGRAGPRPRPLRPGDRYKRLAIVTLWRFGAPVPVLLLLAGRPGAVLTMPREFRPLAGTLGFAGAGDPWLVGGLLAGTTIGLGAGVAIAAWRAWRRRPVRRWFGDFAHLEAEGAAERRWASVLALVAGTTEEGYFRLLLPLLAAMAMPEGGAGAVAGFAGSTLIFGAAHRYQGWRGVAMTTLVGAAMAALYLASGSLPLAMAYHALVDIGSLVVRPWVREVVGRRTSSSRSPHLRSG